MSLYQYGTKDAKAKKKLWCTQ